MATRAERWNQRRSMAAKRRPRIRVDGCDVKAVGKVYEVTVRGFSLYPVISPPAITVGGVRLEQVRFEKDGTAVHGILRREPASRHVVVDYGFVRAELREQVPDL